MMLWADDMACTAASLPFAAVHFVTRRFESFDFTSPIRSGDIVKVLAQVMSVGTTSYQVHVGDQRP